MNYKVSLIQSIHAVDSLQINEVVVLHMTMLYNYRQHLLVVTLSSKGNVTQCNCLATKLHFSKVKWHVMLLTLKDNNTTGNFYVIYSMC